MSEQEITFVTHTCKNCGKAFVEQDNHNSQDTPPTWRYCPECVKKGFRNKIMTRDERVMVKLYDFYQENNIKDMPNIYIAEMLCDWEAMSIKFNDSTYEYYKKERDVQDRGSNGIYNRRKFRRWRNKSFR